VAAYQREGRQADGGPTNDYNIGELTIPGGTMRKTIVMSVVALLSVVAVAQQKPVSPRKQADAKLGNGKTVSVDYGAPSMRGRKIMGGLVPYGKVWRTGANEATKFHTASDLTVNGTKVPAGDYTLYTLPGDSSWKLIINKQTGQWGTEYDESKDLARIDMNVAKTPAPVEQMEIKLEPKGGDVILHVIWENTDASVDLKPAS
jgi:hypothetical protein